MKSIFEDKHKEPITEDLQEALADTFPLWDEIRDYTIELYPDAKEEWKHAGAKFGWGFRISDKKRVIIYLLPRDKFFRAAFVFGQKATDEIMGSDVSEDIKTELMAAKVYAEGRGIRLEVADNRILEDIKKLVAIKIRN